MLTQGKDDNEAGREKDKQDTVNTIAREYNALSYAPEWWNKASNSRHDAFFVIPPMTAQQIVAHIGQIKEEYEHLAYCDRNVFWSAPIATFSRTRVSKVIPKDKSIYYEITVRNANTALKLAELAGGTEK